jgi:1-acyl-sn-glycerol-3-phosphate acyltransferase
MDDWRYEPIQSLPPDALATNSRLMNALRGQVYVWLQRWLRSRFDFDIQGNEVFQRVPQFILVANHTSHLDTICLLAALPPAQRNRCYSAAAEDYFYTHIFKEQVARLLANTFPFRRHEDAHRSLEACARILERGDSLIFFPEGTRSRTGELQRFRKGIGLLVQGKPYPVIPTYLEGTYEALAKGRFRPQSAEIRLHIGSPEYFEGAQPGEASAIEIANRLQARVEALKP